MTAEQFNNWLNLSRLTPTEAAKRLGLSRKTIYRYKNGENPIPTTVQLACKAIYSQG